MMPRYPDPLLKLIACLKKLPGIGNKSAERFAFHLLEWPESQLQEMGSIIQSVKKNIKYCDVCGALIEKLPCLFCDVNEREGETLCIVASAKDVYSIEETREYRGLYHVLGGTLSPFHGKTPDMSMVDKVKARMMESQVREVILAFDSTLEGDATALFLKRELGNLNVRLTRLAFGLPMGSALEYIDGGTLGRALAGRRVY